MVRSIVFCGEQDVPFELEWDEFEDTATHVVGEIEGEPVAAGRIRCLPDCAQLERISVREQYRSRGVGTGLTAFLLSLAQERGYTSYRLNAQDHLQAFYGQFGFRAVGEKFLEAGIVHVPMVRDDQENES